MAENQRSPSSARQTLLNVAIVLLLALGGCRNRVTHAAATRPAVTFEARLLEDRQHGFAASVPAKWATKSDPQNVLTLAGPREAELSIAVPKLPAHIPGMIPLPMVQSGYVDDLSKRWKDVKLGEAENVNVSGGGVARRFDASGVDTNGIERQTRVVLITKGDRLYIVALESPAAEFSKVRDVVDSVAASWKWIK